jgi:WD40 repeat protein/tRNA A-37 threonylcarbamoyl transferase component Bud32
MDRLHELFAAALGLEEPARSQMLARECAGDEALRKAVEGLLAIDEESSAGGGAPALLGGAGSGAEWLAADMASDEPPPESAPDRIGRFRIIREIGRGGMGIVYEAEQDDPARRVALKVIHPGMLSRGLLRRFRHETRALAQLMHPGIARIYEAGAASEAGGRPYFAMELVEGPTLLRYAQDEALDVPARLEMIARVCDALHHAHQKGVIHRDIKPDNILVQVIPGSDAGHSPDSTLRAGVQPKVLDFGVARLAEEEEAVSLRTQSGQIVGTLPYMSPEQASGESAVADIRSDVYSAGVVAFELLSGARPFDTDHMPVHRAVKVVLDQPARRLGAVVPSLRGDVETIVHKAMDPSPDRRYQSAADVAADIRRYLSGQPVAAHRPSIVYQVRKFVARHRTLVGGAAASVTLLVVGVIVASALAVAATRSERRAQWERYRSAVSAAAFAVVNDEAGIARRQLESTTPEFRGWEFRHLMGRIDQSTRVIDAPSIGLPRPYVTAPVGPDNPDSLVLVGDDRSPALARLSLTDTTITPLDPRLFVWYRAQASRSSWRHPAPGPVIWTPDGKGGVQEHRVSPFPFGEGTLYSRATLSGSGQVLAFIAYLDGKVAAGVIDVRDDTCSTLEFDRTFLPIRIALDHEGTRLALAGGLGEDTTLSVRVVDPRTGHLLSEIPDIDREVQGMLLSRDGSRLTASQFGGGLGLWDVSTPRARRISFRAERHDSLQNLASSPDESLLAGATTDGLLRVYHADSLEPASPPLVGHEGEVLGVAFLGSGEIATTGRDGSVRTWRPGDTRSSSQVLRGHVGTVMPLAVASTAGGAVLVTGGWDRTIKRWDLATGRLIGTTAIEREAIDLSLSPDQSLVVCMEADGMCRVLEVATGAEVAGRRFDRITTRPVAFHADSRRVLIDWTPGRPEATFWNVRDNQIERAPATEILSVGSPAVSAPARVIAMTTFGVDGQTTALYYVPAGERMELPYVRRAVPEQVAFSPDGLRIAVAGPDNRIDLYDLRSRAVVGSFIGHTQEVLSIAFSRDGSRLFSSDYTGLIWVWSVETFEELIQLRGHTAHVRRILVTPAGDTLVSTSGDSTARVWTTPPPPASDSSPPAGSSRGTPHDKP